MWLRSFEFSKWRRGRATPAVVPLSWVATALLLAMVAPQLAVARDWVERGPDGGSVQALAMAPSDPMIVYAGTKGNGVFRSNDGGASWTAARAGMGRASVHAVAVHPRDARVLFAGTSDGWVFASQDGGTNWHRANGSGGAALPTGMPIASLALDDAEPPTLCAATGVSVYRSHDLGETWSVSTPGGAGSNAGVVTLAVNHCRPGEVWAGTWSGLFKSVDGGETWEERQYNGSSLRPVRVVAIDPGDPETVFAGSACNWCGESGFAVYPLMRSTDGGSSWTQLAFPAIGGGELVAMEIDPNDRQHLVVASMWGISASRDGGATWPVFDDLYPDDVFDLVGDLVGGDRTLAATSVGVLQSTDDALTWVSSTSGLRAANVSAVAIAGGVAPRVLVATGDQGITALHPSSSRWEPASDGLVGASPCCPRIMSIVADPTSPATVYAGGDYMGAFKSVDGGRHWQPARSGMEQGDRSPGYFYTPFAMAIDPRNPLTLYAATEIGIFKSGDGAATWQPANQGLGEWSSPSTVVLDPSDPFTVLCGGRGVHRSSDGASSWQDVTSGPVGWVNSLAADPGRIGRFYAAAPGDALYRSDDHGLGWVKVPLPTGVGCYGWPGGEPYCPYLTTIAVDPGMPGSVYIGTRNGVWRSLDDGAAWMQVGTASAGLVISSIAFDPASGTIYAGTTDLPEFGTAGAGLLSLSPARVRKHLSRIGRPVP